ncbi:Ferritin-3, chloroplastic [Asimina triloba]
MLLSAAAAASLSANGETLGSGFLASPLSPALNSSSSSLVLRFLQRRLGDGVAVMATKGPNNRPLTGVFFEPFEEVKKEQLMVPSLPQDSLARQKYSNDCEATINEQINVEYNVSYIYHAMFAYFDRDNVALKGLAKFFKESSDEERGHAEKLMEYQNKRGGRVRLQSILMPVSEFDHPEKGDALYAMELALSLEKLTNEKLLHLHAVAQRCKDAQMQDFIETEYLAEQNTALHKVDAIKKISEYVAQLRREFGISIRCFSRKALLLEGQKMSFSVFALGVSLEGISLLRSHFLLLAVVF